MALQKLLQHRGGLGLSTLVPRDQRQVIVRRELVRLEPQALTQTRFRIGHVPLRVQHRSQRVLQHRVVWMSLDEPLDQATRLVVLALAHLRGGKGVLIRDVIRLQLGCPRQCRLRIVEQVHLEADAAESQQDLGIVRGELLRAEPVRRAIARALPAARRELPLDAAHPSTRV